jgi:hypothetical protein
VEPDAAASPGEEARRAGDKLTVAVLAKGMGMVGMALCVTFGIMRRLLCKGLFFKIIDPGRERTNRMKLSSFGRTRPFWQGT